MISNQDFEKVIEGGRLCGVLTLWIQFDNLEI